MSLVERKAIQFVLKSLGCVRAGGFNCEVIGEDYRFLKILP
jgi:hypothetical protein